MSVKELGEWAWLVGGVIWGALAVVFAISMRRRQRALEAAEKKIHEEFERRLESLKRGGPQ